MTCLRYPSTSASEVFLYLPPQSRPLHEDQFSPRMRQTRRKRKRLCLERSPNNRSKKEETSLSSPAPAETEPYRHHPALHPPPKNALPQDYVPASARVFGTFELLEIILSNLSAWDVMHLQRVCTRWRDTVQASAPLRRRVDEVHEMRKILVLLCRRADEETGGG